MRKGLEINLGDLLRELGRKWILLLVIALLCGAAADAYGYRRASNSAARERAALERYAAELGTTADALPDHYTVELAELRAALDEQEAGFVEAAAKLYMYRQWASDRINRELAVGEPDSGDLELVQTLYYANEGVSSSTDVMTSAQKSYYNVLVRNLSGIDMSIAEKEISVPGLLQPKWLVIGLALGLLLGAAVIGFAYALSPKLRLARDLERPFGVPVLLELKKGNREGLAAVAKGVSRMLKEAGLSGLVISGVKSQESDAVCAELSDALRSLGVEARKSAEGETGFIRDIADAGAVLFVEQIGQSRYSELERHVSLCRNFSVPVAGSVVIR